ncbi:MAG TPA: hypothetical protein VGK41_01265 [Solirubrobacterales bacterium]
MRPRLYAAIALGIALEAVARAERQEGDSPGTYRIRGREAPPEIDHPPLPDHLNEPWRTRNRHHHRKARR